MPSAHPIFKVTPPWEYVTQFCEEVGIGCVFPCEFTQDILQVDAYRTHIPQLQNYYHPHKASMFLLTDLENPSKQILKILRQLLRPHNYNVTGHETSRNHRKVTFYRVSHDLTSDYAPKEVILSFD